MVPSLRDRPGNELPTSQDRRPQVGQASWHESRADRKLRKMQDKPDTEFGAPILVMYDRYTSTPIAHVVEEKGVNPYALERVSMEIRNFGYSRIVLKSDQEVSIKVLKQKVKETMRDTDTIPEESPVGEHQSNGDIENAVKTIQGQVRTI